MLVKFKFRDTTKLHPNVMNNYMSYIGSQVKDRHAGINSFEKFDSDFDDLSSEERFIDEQFGYESNDDVDIEIEETENFENQENSATEENINIDQGLFSDTEKSDIESLKASLRNHKGTVWMPIISLKESDARRIGMDKESIWMDKTRKMMPLIAEQIGIPLSNLNWLAGFHEKPYDKGRGAGKQPHIHLLIWEKEPVINKRMIPKVNLEQMKENITDVMESSGKHNNIKKQILEKNQNYPLHTPENYDILLSSSGGGSPSVLTEGAKLSNSPNHKGILTEESDGSDGSERIFRKRNKDSMDFDGQTSVLSGSLEASDDIILTVSDEEEEDLVDINNGKGLHSSSNTEESKNLLSNGEENQTPSHTMSFLSEAPWLRMEENAFKSSCSDIVSFQNLESKDDMDTLSEGLVRIQTRMKRRDTLSEKEKRTLASIDLSPDDNVLAVKRRLAQCVRVSDTIQRLRETMLDDIRSKSSNFRNVKEEDVKKLECQLDNCLFRGMKELGSRGGSVTNVNVLDVIRYGNPHPNATREEIINGIKDASLIAVWQGAEDTAVFSAVREFNRNNSYGLSSRVISDIVDEVIQRSASGEKLDAGDSRVKEDLNNLGYENCSIGRLEINQRDFYQLLASSLKDSLQEAGISKRNVSSSLEVDNYESYIALCHSLMADEELRTTEAWRNTEL